MTLMIIATREQSASPQHHDHFARASPCLSATTVLQQVFSKRETRRMQSSDAIMCVCTVFVCSLCDGAHEESACCDGSRIHDEDGLHDSDDSLSSSTTTTTTTTTTTSTAPATTTTEATTTNATATGCHCHQHDCDCDCDDDSPPTSSNRQKAPQ